MSTAQSPVRGIPVGEALFAGAVVALGAFTIVQAGAIAVPISAAAVGPRAVPYAVGALLVGTGVWVAVNLARGIRGEAEDGEDVDSGVGTDWSTVVRLVASFAALIVLIEPLGWILAATVLFTGVAAALGARPLWRPAVVGLVLALVIHLAFTRLLGVYLPPGILEGVPVLDG